MLDESMTRRAHALRHVFVLQSSNVGSPGNAEFVPTSKGLGPTGSGW